MTKDKEFTLEDLDAMYDAAMAWQPPMVNPMPQADPRAVLQKLMMGRNKPQMMNPGEQQ